ncbi:MAG: CDP-diacylglycerol--serine O-phosphatidyltransferase [Treponema sp.]|jgi:CDP-diacylglycerol--serine O-phosphatidyltransferase|nr:CDP-diacylglycerol--serine O-phosphatidyltransferase [Treponema sp.]
MKKIELKKGIYILPSLITCGNMTFGLLSIMASVEGRFITAAWTLVFALGCDILDGRIARLTHTTSEFGVQLDSLSDLVSFGIAPAMMIYMLALNAMGKVGIAIAILFVLCSALRLARFNVYAQQGAVFEYFVGLPTPASAGVCVSFVLSYELLGPAGFGLNFKTIPILMQTMPAFFKAMPVVMVALSFLMVSNVPYYSFKHMHFSRVKTIQLLTMLIVLVILIIVFPQNIFFIIFLVYALSGCVMFFPNLILKKGRKEAGDKAEPDGDEEEGLE